MNRITRKADANWKGNLSEGHGLVSTHSRVLTEERFAFGERIDGESRATNPEELIGAATAACFSMALSKTLEDDGITAEVLRVGADVDLDITETGPSINHMRIQVEAKAGQLDEEGLNRAVATTAENCPVFQLLQPGFREIELNASLQK